MVRADVGDTLKRPPHWCSASGEAPTSKLTSKDG